jgi:hypothetical protein
VLADQLSPEKKAAPARIALLSVGGVLLAWLLISLVLTQTRGSDKHTVTPGGRTSTMSSTTTTPATSTSPAVVTTASTTSTAGGTAQETSDNAPSEGVMLALLATGAVLILAGALYTRLSTIKLPGAEIGLTPEETAAVAANVVGKAAGGASADDVGHATADALAAATASKASPALDPEEIEEAAVAALKKVGIG